MKSFISKISIFTFIVVAIFFIVIFTNRMFSSFKLEANNNSILLIGHSYSSYAFNDSIIKNVINVSEPGEAYFYSFVKLRKIIDNNPKITTLFINYSNNQIRKEMDNWTWSNEYIQSRFSKYGNFMNLSEYKLLYSSNPVGFREGCVSLFKKDVKQLFNKLECHDELGGFKEREGSAIDSLLENYADFKEKYSDSTSISEINIKSLRKIINFAKSKKMEIYLVRPPLHPKYVRYNNETLFLSILKDQFSDVEFLDFSKFSLSNEEFEDFAHVNQKGALRFSTWLNELLNRRLLMSKDKQRVINAEMSKLEN